MKKIYWYLQQLNKIGGTEMVTLQIISMLINDYEIHIVPFAPIKKEALNYSIPNNAIIEDTGFPDEISQFDINFNKHIKNHKYFKAIKLLFKMLHSYTFGRKKYIKRLESKITKEDIIICASGELMVFAPKNRYVIQHFHFNSLMYKSLISKIFRLISRKPDLSIFLSDSTRENIDSKHKLNSTVILNPCRFERAENYQYNNNSLISVCRFESQKDPMLMVKIARELDKLNFKYTYNIYGSGSYKVKMEKYIKKHCLQNIHLIEGKTDLRDFYASSDLFVITSKFEGYPLTAIEASSLSIPSIWMEMGDPTSSFIIEGENGYIVNKRDPKAFASKIIAALNNKNKLEELKKSTYLTSSRFNKEAIKNKWIDTLNDAFNKNNY